MYWTDADVSSIGVTSPSVPVVGAPVMNVNGSPSTSSPANVITIDSPFSMTRFCENAIGALGFRKISMVASLLSSVPSLTLKVKEAEGVSPARFTKLTSSGSNVTVAVGEPSCVIALRVPTLAGG